ncbi:MAG: hypothetical protein V4702_05400 [Patescibacteria group bacterium]
MIDQPTRGDFTTHFNYIKCLNTLLQDISIELAIHKTISMDSKAIKKFEKLAGLTEKSIDGELAACKLEPEYAEVVAPWIPVKCYYLIYYLESICLHLATGNIKMFKHGGHTYVRTTISSALQKGQIKTVNGEIEKTISVGELSNHRIRSGSNLSPSYFTSRDCIMSVRRKVAEYVERQWKDGQKIKGYRSKVDKAKRDKFYKERRTDLLEYFYQMRLKANYKDVDYLDFENDVTNNDAAAYITVYVASTKKYRNALVTEIKRLKALRLTT